MPGLDQSLTRLMEQPPAQIWARISSVAPPWVSVILVAAIAWQLAQAAWLFVPSDEPAAAAPAAATAAPRRPAEPAANVMTIVQAHWFGEARPEAAVKQHAVRTEKKGRPADEIGDRALAEPKDPDAR